MTLSHWHRASRGSAVSCDIAVVGGGVLGCSTAYWLQRTRPGLRIVIVEAGQLAQGASGRNAGFLLQGTASDYMTDINTYGVDRARKLWQFSRENRDLIFSELRDRSFDLEPSGSLTVAGTEEEDGRLQASVTQLRSSGIPVAYIPPQETNHRLVGRGFHGALYVPSGAMLNPVKLVRHIAEESGAQVLEHHPVLSIKRLRGQVYLETRQRHIQAGQVVLALNAYLPKLYPSLKRYVRPVRAQMLATEPMPPRWLHVPAYTHNGFYYIRQNLNGSVLLGGARHLHQRTEVGYADITTPSLQADLEHYLHTHFPQTRSLSVHQRWSGVMGFSPDHLPVIGAVPEQPGSLWAAGFTGHGMGYGFRFGRLMAELALGYPRPEGFDLFSIERFNQAQSQAEGAGRGAPDRPRAGRVRFAP